MGTRRIAGALLAGSAAVLLSAGPGFAAEVTPEKAGREEAGRAVKLPETASDHLAMAKEYDEKAAAWRSEAEYHREMAAAYKKERPDFKGGARNPWTVRMEKHCSKIYTDAEKLAADAEESARYHRLRAKELEGK